eukprot:TRINITY_DN12348_c0_g1_i1.p1 TRINITY_DN12348_c0_g1~~TRINITY_DN12348_c0_g1_i1.p1  ORF type:complete len:828 (-),score=166.34 TRINITY_DN12348_c0_g1_i1:236-2719(-)
MTLGVLPSLLLTTAAASDVVRSGGWLQVVPSCESFCNKRNLRAEDLLCAANVDEASCSATFEADKRAGHATPCSWACGDEEEDLQKCACKAQSNASAPCAFVSEDSSPQHAALVACAGHRELQSTTSTTTDAGVICSAFCEFANLRATGHWCANVAQEDKCVASYVTKQGLTVPCRWVGAQGCVEDSDSAMACRYNEGSVLAACGGNVIDASVSKMTPAAGLAGVTIPNSNRSAAAPCIGSQIGDECSYACIKGYSKAGRHVFQNYVAAGEVIANNTFFGGRCVRHCSGSADSCSGPETAIRVEAFDAKGACLRTTCLPKETAMLNLARGNYEVWRQARNPHTGIYLSSYDLGASAKAQDWQRGDTSATGIGLAMECVAHAMGWISMAEAQSRVLQTLRSLIGEGNTAGPPRGPHGWMPRTFDSELEMDASKHVDGSIPATGLHFSGLLVAKTFFRRNDPGSLATSKISEMADRHLQSVDWSTILESSDKWDESTRELAKTRGWEGNTGIPFLYQHDGKAVGVNYPRADEAYEFSEAMPAVWVAHQVLCKPSETSARCENKDIDQMWERFQKRRSKPSQSSTDGMNVLSLYAGYIVQLPQYLVHAFAADKMYQDLFRNSWRADREFYTGDLNYAGEYVYGLGAGSTLRWCSGGKSFAVDRMPGKSSGSDLGAGAERGCRTYSAYAVAGYLPASQDVIDEHLLQLLAEGSAVREVPDTHYHILGRRSLADPTWRPPLPMVDFATELLGLSTRWLGMDFWLQNTLHFDSILVQGSQGKLEDVKGSWRHMGSMVADTVASIMHPVLGEGVRHLMSAFGGVQEPGAGHVHF